MTGYGRYHRFSPGRGRSTDLNPSFYLMVSDKFRDGKLVYEDIGPITEALRDELAGYTEWTIRTVAREMEMRIEMRMEMRALLAIISYLAFLIGIYEACR